MPIIEKEGDLIWRKMVSLDLYLLSSRYMSDISLEMSAKQLSEFKLKGRVFLLEMCIFESCLRVICVEIRVDELTQGERRNGGGQSSGDS